MSLKFSNNSNESIASKLNPSTIELFKNKIQTNNMIDALNKYTLVITGTIGAGKSTICESLSYIFNSLNIITNNYPEFLYIDDEFSHRCLEKKILGHISDLTFQSYVLDNWIHILDSNKNNTGMKIFERCVDDSILCFCNISNKTQKLTNTELFSLFEKLQYVNTTYNIPSYFDQDLHFTEINSSTLDFNLQQILEIIVSDIDRGITSRIIGLSVSSFDSKCRIQQRSRTGESNYTPEMIDVFNNHYKKLYKQIKKHKRLERFLDLGKLL